jgi:hypothetical protein
VNLRRPNILHQELSNIGVVYLVVLVVLVGALIYGVISSGDTASLEAAPAFSAAVSSRPRTAMKRMVQKGGA